MGNEQPTPLRASFWLTDQEKGYVLMVCALFLIGIVARYFFLKNEVPEVYTHPNIEQVESNGE